MSKPALGRGLSALLGGKPPRGPVSPAPGSEAGAAGPAEGAMGTVATAAANPVPGAAGAGGVGAVVADDPSRPAVMRVAVGRIRASSLQPRRDFPAESLQELADSIREQGILQPLVVRRQGEYFELIAGERRWRAAQLAGLKEVPLIVREADDATTLELMLIENLQREDLNPIDEAQGYTELMERFRLTQEAVATKVGRSRTAVTNALRLLKLPKDVQAMVGDGRLSTGHAKVLLGLTDGERQASAARSVVVGGLSVRQTEDLVARLAPSAVAGTATANPAARPAAVPLRDPHVAAVEDKLRQRLGTKVSLRYRQGKGQIDIRFFSDAELERVLEIVGIQPD